ncbi:hypothetical protein [Pelosinus sp. IPA-1]|uniref:hypothetical protein n=1 Tax=Pelosinus sp. IPA-1 TaxID=3029569 RepID=UPI0024362508|nr:hypothetical protein [Pelosinus sp. IPA-1]GMA98846.1 hypothetical protein PIPA1_16460 [Pelosinus sp. IPA-1]
MNKKLTMWQWLLIGSAISSICLHLQYPFNLIILAIALVVLVVHVVKNRDKYDKFNIAGMAVIVIGGLLIASTIMGYIIGGLSVATQILAAFVVSFTGMFLIGIGNHLSDPARVSKKALIIASTMSYLLLFAFYILIKLVETRDGKF